MTTETHDVVVYHNPDCGTSRNVLAMIRNAGIEPHIVEYLRSPPSRAMVQWLVERMQIPARGVLREKDTPYAVLGLDSADAPDKVLLDAIMTYPILLNRPIVVTSRGVKLCRPSETVLDILPAPQRGEFRKEDGELVVDAHGQRVGKGEGIVHV